MNNIYINFRAKAIKQETGVKARKLSFSFSLKIKNRRLMSKISSRLKKILIFWLRALFWRIFEESTSIAHNPHWVFEILLLFNGSSPQSYFLNNDYTFWKFEEKKCLYFEVFWRNFKSSYGRCMRLKRSSKKDICFHTHNGYFYMYKKNTIEK